MASLWLLVNVLLFTMAWKWARRLFPADSHLDLLQHALVLSWTSILAATLLLGAMGYLNGHVLLVAVLGLSLAALALLHQRRAPKPPCRGPLERHEKYWLLVWAAVFGLWMAHVALHGLQEFPDDWDSLAYHIPLIDHWLQAGSFYSTDCARWMNPGNGEVLGFWSVSAFSGDFFISLTNVLPTLLFACSGRAIAERIGLHPPLAHACALTLVSNLVVLKQLIDAENDVAVVACFLATLSYALRYHFKPGTAPLFLGAISLGILTGVKYYALGYALLALTVWVVLAASTNARQSFLRVLCSCAGCMLLLGGFWYLRNWAMTGSPLYPMDFLGRSDLLSELYPHLNQSSFLGNRRPELLSLYITAIQELMGPFHLAAFLLAPVTFTWLVGASCYYAFRLRELKSARLFLVMALLLLGTAILLGITPLAVEDEPGTLNQMYWRYCPVRYGLCFLSIAALAVMLPLQTAIFACPMRLFHYARFVRLYWVTHTFVRARVVVYLVLVGAAFLEILSVSSVFLAERLQQVLIAIIVVSLAYSLVVLKTSWPRLPVRFAVLSLLVPGSAAACAFLSQAWHAGYTLHYQRIVGFRCLSLLQNEVSVPHTVVVLQSRCYPFFGSGRQHRVIQPVRVSSPDWMMDLLENDNVDYVVVGLQSSFPGTNSKVRFEECLRRHPNRFHPLLELGEHTLLEVVPFGQTPAKTGCANPNRIGPCLCSFGHLTITDQHDCPGTTSYPSQQEFLRVPIWALFVRVRDPRRLMSLRLDKA